jgi:predicted sugar kinase
MAPAVARGDFVAFSESLYEYGHASGLLFAEEQGGPYNGRALHDLVQRVRGMGIAGVAQSSWGPTLFAVLPDQLAACEFQAKLNASLPEPLVVQIASPCNQGARIEINP